MSHNFNWKNIPDSSKLNEYGNNSERQIDKFFFDINASKELLSVLAKVKNEEYLKYCRKAYGEMIGTC